MNAAVVIVPHDAIIGQWAVGGLLAVVVLLILWAIGWLP